MNHIDNFEKYHRDNPEVWRLWLRFTGDLLRAGRKHGGAGAVAERIRWEAVITTVGDYKINNNYNSFYARMFALCYPTRRRFFRTRISAADGDGMEERLRALAGL